MATNQRQKLQKKATALPPRAVHASGGTSALKAAARSGTSGLGGNIVAPNPGRIGPGHPASRAGSGGQPGAVGGGAPALPPAGSGALPPPETQERLRERDESNTGYIDSVGDYKYGLYQAALKYGDPSVISLYGDSANPPTGAVSEIARREAAGQKSNTLAHNANNTFFSGMNLEDVKNISDEASNERARALQEFEDAKHELDQAWVDAQNRHRWNEEGFDEGAQGEFEASEPTPQAAAPGAAPPPNTRHSSALATKKHPVAATAFAPPPPKKKKGK